MKRKMLMKLKSEEVESKGSLGKRVARVESLAVGLVMEATGVK